LKVRCQLIDIVSGKPSPFMLLPKSSTGIKTPLRQSNCIEVIDARHTGNLVWIVDNPSLLDFKVNEGWSYVQIIPYIVHPISYIFPVPAEDDSE
jgi:dUTPase